MRAVLGRALKLTAAGVVLGIGGAMVATRLLASLLFEVQTTDASTLLAGSVLVAAVSTVAGLTPALRATRVDPIACSATNDARRDMVYMKIIAIGATGFIGRHVVAALDGGRP